jgi:hypothetical protein
MVTTVEAGHHHQEEDTKINKYYTKSPISLAVNWAFFCTYFTVNAIMRLALKVGTYKIRLVGS